MKIKEQAPSFQNQYKKYTYRDYLKLPEDGKRYELINGELLMAPAPNIYHQTISNNLEDEIRSFLKKYDSGKMFHAPTDIKLSDTIILQPDILFISQERLNIIKENYIDGAPDLIIEILSPSSAYYDLLEKKELYEQFGVMEYWIVDPKKQRVEIYMNHSYKFELDQRAEKEGILKSKVIDGLEITIKVIFLNE